MFNFLKLIALALILWLVWLFIAGKVPGDISWRALVDKNSKKVAITEAELWANPSSYKGSVFIEPIRSRPMNSTPEDEYVTIDAASSNGAAIDITGWALESTVSRTKVFIPPAVLLLTMGEENHVSPVFLAPGEYALVLTGTSPVGHSFHTNTCTGYLSQFNSFYPRLPNECPLPSDVLPATVENIRAYGAACIEFLQKAEQCQTYVTAMPAELLPRCRELIVSKLNYNTCLSESYDTADFSVFNNGGWRLYLNRPAELWANSYEILRLLDAEGKTVDVLQY